MRNPLSIFRRSRGSYSSMSDRELGRHARMVFGVLGSADGIKRIGGAGAALFLVDHAIDANAETLTINLKSVSLRDREIGDWTIVVCRKGADPSADLIGEAEVVLAGTIRKGREQEAIDCFEKLTVCHISAREEVA